MCYQVLKTYNISSLSQDNQNFTLILAVLLGAVVPHLERCTIALESWHYHDLSDHWGLGGVFIPFPIPSNVSLLPPTIQFT
jgi:hypothetical protein